MKEKIVMAGMAIAMLVLASCEKMENVGYDSDAGMSQQKVQTTRMIQPAASVDTVFFTAVPAHEDADGVLRDGVGTQKAHRCLFIRKNDGCKIVVFPYERVLPTIEEIESAPFIEGDMSEYNSAYFDVDASAWLPAISEDYEKGIRYSVLSSTKGGSKEAKRTVLNSTLEGWNWQNLFEGKFSTVLDGYTVSVDNGKLTVKHKYGETTLEL